MAGGCNGCAAKVEAVGQDGAGHCTERFFMSQDERVWALEQKCP
jgi:hypothetical protein